MAAIKEISGTYTQKDLDRLQWPIAWSGNPDQTYEAALSRLVSEAEGALLEDPDAVAVEIAQGRVVATVHSDD